MYKRKPEGWLKHFDFIVLDLVCLHMAFILSYWIWIDFWNPYAIDLYRAMGLFLTLADIAVMFFCETLKNVLKRGYYKEFLATLKNSTLVVLLGVVFLFLLKSSAAYSRATFLIMGVLYVCIAYPVRLLWKRVLRSSLAEKDATPLLIVTGSAAARETVERVQSDCLGSYRIVGLAILDTDLTGQEIAGIPVVASLETTAEFVCREWVDEVFVLPPQELPYPAELIDQLNLTGVTVHLNLAKATSTPGSRQLVERIGSYTVLTSSMNFTTPRQAFLKRSLDIAGGIAGSLITLLLCLVLGPAIYLSSPGPIFFAQTRVGKNGKRFKMYKFRSMYMDAEARKAELMKDNRVGDGMMFKLDFDPRIIGNRILPDGSRKTGLGQFIRSTSLDEFPQFFNVLKGDMSLVGTRPPTLDEWEKYDLHHRARLAIKPGITGLWQISGRSDITDFEEVVRLDTQYISTWSLGQDIKILLKTVLAVLKRDGSM